MSNSPFCECHGDSVCGVCLTERQDAYRLRDWESKNPIRCICPPDAAYHTSACLKQDWTLNTRRPA
jgi:hypothetical protein